MIQSVGHASLLPLYAAAAAAVLVLIVDLAVGRRSAILGTAAAGALATVVCAVLGGSAPTFCLGDACSWTPSPAATV
ncbi:NADH-quinone oxidoreductase subunit N, partial [Actinoplanes sp. NPDC051633]